MFLARRELRSNVVVRMASSFLLKFIKNFFTRVNKKEMCGYTLLCSNDEVKILILPLISHKSGTPGNNDVTGGFFQSFNQHVGFFHYA